MFAAQSKQKAGTFFSSRSKAVQIICKSTSCFSRSANDSTEIFGFTLSVLRWLRWQFSPMKATIRQITQSCKERVLTLMSVNCTFCAWSARANSVPVRMRQIGVVRRKASFAFDIPMAQYNSELGRSSICMRTVRALAVVLLPAVLRGSPSVSRPCRDWLAASFCPPCASSPSVCRAGGNRRT